MRLLSKRAEPGWRTAGLRKERVVGSTAEQAAPPTVRLDEAGIGASLLRKMGWQTGQGLGLSREGRSQPITAHVYTPGAGIGSHRTHGIGSQALPTVEEYAAQRAQDKSMASRTAWMQQRYAEGMD